MSKHTPGPWTQREFRVYAPHVVADCQTQADARLIADAPTNPHDCGDLECAGYREWLKYRAAPELLEVCRMALKDLEAELVWGPVRDALTAVIKKAEGA